MQLATMSALTFTALALGFLTGRTWERCTRAWSDLKVAKGQVALLRVAARVLSRKAAAAPAAWDRKWSAITRYRSQVPMLWPGGRDWRAELTAHAVERGGGFRPAEMLWEPT